MTVRTRMAPSPTGNLHLGTAYATLWPYLFAKKNKGTFILRIEDTDQDRSTKEFAENIISGLKWLELDWDEGPYYQMQRLDLYKKASDKLIEEGKAYYCFCTKEELETQRKKQLDEKRPQVYSGKCRNLTKQALEEKLKLDAPFVIRYKLPDDRGVVEYKDMIHGKVSIDSSLLGDMVIMRKNGIPLYNFAVIVDDLDMGITHVLRGDDHVSNTPKQILFSEALGVKPPEYGHYPMILNQDRVGKLSKRTGSTSLEDYKKEGYLPKALVNYLALLGWTPPDGKEVLSIEEIIESFDIKDMNPSASAWDEQKLDWINGEYIRKFQISNFKFQILEYLKYISGGVMPDHPTEEEVEKVAPLVQERIKKLSDIIPLTDFLWEKPEYDKEVFEKLLSGHSDPEQVLGEEYNLKNILEKILQTLESLKKPWEAKEFESSFRKLAEEFGLNTTQMLQLIRVAISGQTVTPPLFESIKILGEEETINRVENLLNTQGIV